MNRRVPPLSPEVQALLENERAIPTQPAVVRQRALARARAAITAYPQRSARRRVTGVLTRPHRKRWFVATMLTCAAAAAAGTTAFQLRARFSGEAHRAVPVAGRPSPAPADDRLGAALLPEADVPADEAPAVAPPAERPVPPTSHADATRLELRLLRQARAAVAREDYGTALGRIAEHARRFKDGRLAEEREALRVKALAGLGRTDEARRAAAAFKVRFPRSVLLPAVSRLADS